MASGYASSRLHAGNDAEGDSSFGPQRRRPRRVLPAASANSSGRTMFSNYNDSLSLSYGSFVGGSSGHDFSPSRSPTRSSPSARRPSVFTTTSGSRYYYDGGDDPPIPISRTGQPPNYPSRVAAPPQPNDAVMFEGGLHPHHYTDRGREQLLADRGGGSPLLPRSAMMLEHVSEIGRHSFPVEPPFLRSNIQPCGDRHYPPEHQHPHSHHLHHHQMHSNEFGLNNPTMEGIPFPPDSYKPNKRNAGGVPSPPPPPPYTRSVEPVVDTTAQSRRCLNKADTTEQAGHRSLERGIPIDQVVAGTALGNVPSHYQHEVQCLHCHLFMLVSKQTVVVQCPDCDAVSPATNAKYVSENIASVASLKEG
jgi:hypothetical protein